MIKEYFCSKIKIVSARGYNCLSKKIINNRHTGWLPIKLMMGIAFLLLFSNKVMADYTIAAGSNIDASTLTGQSGVLTINGTLTVNGSVFLSGFTAVIINGPGGNIFWTVNKDLSFNAGILFDVNNPGLTGGLQPTGGSAAKSLTIGGTTIAVSNDNSNNAAFSFAQFNAAGGLPKFTLTAPASVCYGNSLIATLTPNDNVVSFDCYWSVSKGSISPVNSKGFTTPQAATITPISSAIAENYTVSCSVTRAGDADIITTKQVTILVNPLPPLPTSVLASPANFCLGSSSNLTATSTGNTIKWYSVNVAGTSLGSSASGVNFPVAPIVNTTYYAEAIIPATGCVSTTRNPITITVNPLPAITFSLGSLGVCTNSIAQTITQAYSTTTNAPTQYSIVWNGSPSNSFVNINNALLTASPISITVPANTVPNSYTGNLTVKNANGCLSNPAIPFSVSVNAPITITSQPSTSSFCLGSNASIGLTASGTLPTYQWQFSASGIGGTYTNLSNSGIYAGVSSSSLNLTAPPIGLSSNFYRVLVNGTCGSITSDPIALKFGNLWIGKISSNWNDPNNWSDGILPSTICSNVLIPNQVYQPTLSSSPEVVINNLIIDPDATLTVANATMKIAGSITNNGSLDVSKGTLDFNGTLPQNISGKLFLDSSIQNLIVSNETGLSLSSTLGRLNITGDLAFGNVNNATFNTGDNLVLASNATVTARVADITNGGVNFGNKFSGKVTVERYFPARRAWRLVTAPLSGAGSIFSTWQNNGVFASGKGTYVTGPIANLLTNGMDPSPLNNSSLKFGSALSPITNTITTNLSTATGNSDNKGFFIFVRGDRTANNLSVNYCNTTTLKSSGILQTGDQQFAATPSLGAFTLIGNPYASPVDFSKLVRTNLNNRFYAWDPYLGNDQGGYVIIDDILNTGIYTSTPSSPGGQTKIIQSSQAVFVVTANPAVASIKFTESAKSSSNLQGLFRPVTGPLFFKTNLYLQNDNGSSSLADGNLIQFNNHFNAGVDMQDAIKLSNVYETIGLANGTTSLAINRRPILASRDTLFLNFSRNRQRKYQFEFVAGKIQRDNLAGFLEDQYLKKLTPLNMDGITKVDFEVSSNPLSAASNRFRVLFNPSVSFNKINAAVKDDDIAIEWEVSDEYNIKSYDIERSRNGVSFTKLDSSLASGNGKKLVSYAWLDREPLPGYYYYRIRSLSNNGVVGYSKVVKVKMNRSTNDLYVSPNPVTENNIQIQMNKMPPGVYRVRLISTIGQVLGNYSITHVKNMSKETIHLANRLAPGIYQLEITFPTNKVKKITISVQ